MISVRTTERQFRKYHTYCAEAYEPGRRDTFTVGNDVGFLNRHTATGEMIVAIAGSNDLRDWLPIKGGNANLESRKIVQGISAHAGFLVAAEAIANCIRDDISAWLSQPGRTITFCGHSRGGAIAQILPLCLRLNPAVVAIVAFASPKCLFTTSEPGQKSPGLLRRRCLLFEQGADIVPVLPVSSTAHPWRRVGTVVRRGLSGRIAIENNSRETLLSRIQNVARLTIAHRTNWETLPLGLLGLTEINGAAMAKSVLDAHSLSSGYAPKGWWET